VVVDTCGTLPAGLAMSTLGKSLIGYVADQRMADWRAPLNDIDNGGDEPMLSTCRMVWPLSDVVLAASARLGQQSHMTADL